MRLTRIGCATIALTGGAGACGSAWTLDLEIEVSSRRQAELSDYPAQLVLVTDSSQEAGVSGPEGHAFRIANLCSPEHGDFVVRLELEGDDCSRLPRFVQAWLEPREEGADSKCGQLDDPTPLRGLRRPPHDALYAEALAFQGASDCGGLADEVTLKLDW